VEFEKKMGGSERSISCSCIVKWQRNMLKFHVNIRHLAFSYWRRRRKMIMFMMVVMITMTMIMFCDGK